VFYFVIAAILAVVFVIALLVGLFGPDPEYKDDVSPRGAGKVVAGLTVLAFILVTVGFSFTTVGARSVGIQTSFGKYQKTLDNGAHMTAPWANVEEFSTQIQTLRLDGSETGVRGTDVNYAGGGRGVIDATVAWKISDKEAKALWERYRSFDKVRDDLVTAGARAAVREVVGQKSPTDAQAGASLEPMARDIKSKLIASFAQYGVEVDSVRITAVILDEKTQQSIEKVVAAQQDIERAKADKKRAEIDAETAKIRAQSGSLGQGGLQRYCLEVMNSWDAGKNGPLPAGFNCFGGNNVGLVTPTK
jgi:regulator of protease activity HflC (stomatin/prohibitin superfamily)